jgi:hypothetical protein
MTTWNRRNVGQILHLINEETFSRNIRTFEKLNKKLINKKTCLIVQPYLHKREAATKLYQYIYIS